MAPDSPSDVNESRHGRFALGVFLICALVNVYSVSTGWKNNIREIHESRQVQTALSAQQLQADNWRLEYPLPVFGPPWSAPFEFPLFQWLAAACANVTGLPLEQAGRLVALLAFYLILPAVWLLQHHLPIPRAQRWLLPAILLITPCYVYYSRSFMIESTALCVATWFLAFLALGLRAERRRISWLWFTLAALTGAAAAMVKLPTFAVFLLPAALLAWTRWKMSASQRRSLAVGLVVIGVVGVAGLSGLLWTRYADDVKAGNPLAAGFVSSELQSFVFGSAKMRFTSDYWRDLGRNAATAALPATNAVLLIVFGLLLAHQRRGAVAALLGAFAMGPLVFANLYAVHDYYFYACALFAAAGLAIAWSNILDQEQFPVWARWSVVTLSAVLQYSSYRSHYWPAQIHNPQGAPEIANALQAVTAPDEVVVVFGHDWNPTLSYYSGRRTIMIVDRFFADTWRLNEVLGRLDKSAVGAMVVSGELRNKPETTRVFASRLQLSARPALVGPDTAVFLPAGRIDDLAEKLAKTDLRSITLADAEDDESPVPRQRVPADKLADPRIVSMMSPRPDEIVHPFGPAAHELDGRVIADAHAPTDVVFSVPDGARKMTIGFGLLPGAYRQERPTDGVEFRIEWIPSKGRKRTIFSRELRPTEERKDRGTHTATIDLPPNAEGKLLIRTLPGVSGSIASDWAYWSEITIR